MAVETTNFISGLDINLPNDRDTLGEADNHLKLIKAMLKTQFPGSGGNGFSKAITATEDEINAIAGISGNIQQQIDNLNTNIMAPPNTRMIFAQSTAPTGWTQDTSSTIDERALMAVNTASSGVGGSHSIKNSFDLTHYHETSPHTLTIDEMPTHTHSYVDSYHLYKGVDKGGSSSVENKTTESKTTGSSGGSNPHEHGDTSVGKLSSNDSNLPDIHLKYLEVIIAVKD